VVIENGSFRSSLKYAFFLNLIDLYS
jgi:hypothetical protein